MCHVEGCNLSTTRRCLQRNEIEEKFLAAEAPALIFLKANRVGEAIVIYDRFLDDMKPLQEQNCLLANLVAQETKEHMDKLMASLQGKAN